MHLHKSVKRRHAYHVAVAAREGNNLIVGNHTPKAAGWFEKFGPAFSPNPIRSTIFMF